MAEALVIYSDECNEGETPIITSTTTGSNSVDLEVASIDSIKCSVYDYFTGTEIRAEAAITPIANPVSTTLTESETRIINTGLTYEYRVITFLVTYDTDKHINDEYILRVKNLRHHSVSA
jgi:hypothetical protein